jgi:hypothetical protein
VPAASPSPGAGAAFNRDQCFQQFEYVLHCNVLRQVLEIAEKTGNMRIDCATIGAADDIGNNAGFIVLMARGLYDRKALVDYIAKDAKYCNYLVTLREEKGVHIAEFSDHAMLLPSNELLVLLAGTAHDKLPLDEILAALAGGKGKMATNAALAKVITTVDMTKPLWAAMTVGEAYRQTELLAPFDSLTLIVEPKGQALEFTIKALGGDKDKTAAAVKMLTHGLEKELTKIKSLAWTTRGDADLIETIKTIKAAPEGGNATLTGTVKSGDWSMMMRLMMLVLSHASVEPALPPAMPAVPLPTNP